MELTIEQRNYILAIRHLIPETASYEQAAEECCELAQALLKKARKYRAENYTPKTIEEINKDIQEEFTDVMLCMAVLGIKESPDILNEKLERWVKRNLKDKDLERILNENH